MDGNKHYIRVDDQNRVIFGHTSGFPELAEDGDICILEDGQRSFNAEWGSLTNGQGQFLYKWEGGQMVERSQAELDTEWNASATSRYRESRAREYPPIGDQLDAILKYISTQTLPAGSDIKLVVDKWQAVKTKYPKPVSSP